MMKKRGILIIPTVGHKFHSCGRSLKYIYFKKFSFGQKRLCVLRDFVPRGVFLQSRGGRDLKTIDNINNLIGPVPWLITDIQITIILLVISTNFLQFGHHLV